MSEYLQNAAYLVAHLVAVFGGRGGEGVMYSISVLLASFSIDCFQGLPIQHWCAK